MTKLEWNKLLSSERERVSATPPNEPFRNAFDKDYERVISSSSVRRLQDKAQVFPLQENDFTRTRLTHSLEVSSIGRSLGKRVGYGLKQRDLMQNEQVEELASLLAVAGLVHDLGNPPFGHYGEAIIREWFENNLELFETASWVKDYLYFDGNAQTIRILSRLQFLHDRHGMNFSFGTLGTLMKYPWSSESQQTSSKRKIGYFISEQDLINNILISTGMKNAGNEVYRHPATYLLEAADDIAYLFADLEDTAKKGDLPWEKVKKQLIDVANEVKAFSGLQAKLQETKERNKDKKISFEENIPNEVMDFRVFCQSVCIVQVGKEFINNYDAIMEGKYNDSLLESEAIKKMVGKEGVVRDICIEYAYSNNEVLSLELIGKSVLTSLLEKFIRAVLDEAHYLDPRHESGKLYKLISTNFKYIQNLNEKSEYQEKILNQHERVQLVIDYISCMTDSYALNLHKTLLGMKLP